MYGYLELRRGLFGGWERLYFNLNPIQCTLSYSQDPAAPAANEVIPLTDARVHALKEGHGKRFEIRTAAPAKKEYLLKAESPTLCQDWVKAIFSAQMHEIVPSSRGRAQPMVNFDPRVEVCTYAVPQRRRRRAHSIMVGQLQHRQVMVANAIRQRLVLAAAAAQNEDDDEFTNNHLSDDEDEETPQDKAKKQMGNKRDVNSTIMALLHALEKGNNLTQGPRPAFASTPTAPTATGGGFGVGNVPPNVGYQHQHHDWSDGTDADDQQWDDGREDYDPYDLPGRFLSRTFEPLKLDRHQKTSPSTSSAECDVLSSVNSLSSLSSSGSEGEFGCGGGGKYGTPTTMTTSRATPPSPVVVTAPPMVWTSGRDWHPPVPSAEHVFMAPVTSTGASEELVYSF